jgi:hypothetical protein
MVVCQNMAFPYKVLVTWFENKRKKDLNFTVVGVCSEVCLLVPSSPLLSSPLLSTIVPGVHGGALLHRRLTIVDEARGHPLLLRVAAGLRSGLLLPCRLGDGRRT